MSKLSEIFDGELHWLEIDDQFPNSGASLVIDGFEEGEEEDVLSPFESPTQEPILRETYERTDKNIEMFPLGRAAQAWGALSTTLTALSYIMEFGKHQYQHTHPDPQIKGGEVRWSFKTDTHVSDRL